MSSCNTVFTNGIPVEALNAAGQTVVRAMKKIIDQIWKTGEWPNDWDISKLVTLPKVPRTQECNKYRTISLISHASKILPEILMKRLQYYITKQIADKQSKERRTPFLLPETLYRKLWQNRMRTKCGYL